MPEKKNKDLFDIMRDCLHGRYVIFQSSGFHQRLESVIIHDLKESLALSNPMHNFSTVI